MRRWLCSGGWLDLPLVLHHLDGRLDLDRVSQQLPGLHRPQVLIQLQQNGRARGQRHVDDVAVRYACRDAR